MNRGRNMVLTGAAIQAIRIALPVPSTELGEYAIDLLCLALEIKLGTKAPIDES